MAPSLSAENILACLPTAGRPEKLIYLDTVGSTNDYAKALADEGVTHAAVIADEQTAGKGRMGRGFHSPKGKGIYLSMLYRPALPAARAVTLTAHAAVAVCEAVQAVTGAEAYIKWPNDIVLDGKKLCGILTESAVGADGALRYVIIGTGLNVSHRPEDFPPEVADMATSLSMRLGHTPDRAALCAGLITAMDEIYDAWQRRAGNVPARYRALCVTAGKPVRVLRGDSARDAFALGIDDEFGLVVRYADGATETVTAGEVSVRGLWGYCQ